MHHKYENGILVDCTECIVDIKKRLRGGVPFDIPEKFGRDIVLEFIISRLFYISDHRYEPQKNREYVTQSLINHGQFKQDEIDEIFERNAEKTVQFRIRKYSSEDEENNLRTEYHFPIAFCDDINIIGYCRMDIEVLKCPDCGFEVTNTPNNVTMSYEKDLVCPVCPHKGEIHLISRE